jgi:hypothetical protein
MAIAWTYRRDYSAVNFPMLPVRDESGRKGRRAGRSSRPRPRRREPAAPAVLGLGQPWYGAAALAWARASSGGRRLPAAREPRRLGPQALPLLPRLPSPGPRRSSWPTGCSCPPMTVHDLPPIEATLNGIATVAHHGGLHLHQEGRPAGHRACMLSAAVASALFLVFYVTYHALMLGHAHALRPRARSARSTSSSSGPTSRLRRSSRSWSRAPSSSPCRETSSGTAPGPGHLPHLVLRVGDGVLVYFFLYQWWPYGG